jgi:hypothetical protein
MEMVYLANPELFRNRKHHITNTLHDKISHQDALVVPKVRLFDFPFFCIINLPEVQLFDFAFFL